MAEKEPEIYEFAYYTNIANLKETIMVILGLGGFFTSVFLGMLMLSAFYNPSFIITEELTLFATILGFISGFGVVLFMVIFKHPNENGFVVVFSLFKY